MHRLEQHNILLEATSPKLNTALKELSHSVAQDDSHFPSPASYIASDTDQDALGHLGTLLSHVQLAVDEYHPVLF